MRPHDEENVSAAPDGAPPGEQPHWRRQFPIDVAEDEYRSRRDFTKLLGLTSLAFVSGQGFIIAQSITKKSEGPLPEIDVAALDELEVGMAKVFQYPHEGNACVLVRISEDNFVAYGQKCTHLSCPVIPKPRDGKFYCPCHNGSFDLHTGRPLAGPPRRALPKVTLKMANGRIIATGLEHGVV
ncbi:MAG: Rieske (2Fe-2S) protein [Candidatus Hydrogenedentes bacterium]|nr:Rieske (2Fe-2S) protein [Candidatus Hydrogenedentota bacterium]